MAGRGKKKSNHFLMRAVKCRIYPNKEQETLFWKTFGCCRFIYNQMLEEKEAHYKETGKTKQVTPAAYKAEYPWLKEVDSLALCNVQLDLEQAYKRFFEDASVGHPKFRKRHDKQSYTTNVVNGNIRFEEGKLRLPKCGPIKIKMHRQVPDIWRLVHVTVSAECGNYYISLQYETNIQKMDFPISVIAKEQILGLDYSMGELYVASDESRGAYPQYYRSTEKKLAREQRRLSNCQRGSQRYQKQKRKVARVHQKIKNQRKDFLHKESRKIANSWEAVCVEDISMKEMSSDHRFGKSVMDNGWGMFRQMLCYKLTEQGKQYLMAGKWYPSTKRCSRCGGVKVKMELSERKYVCTCGMTMDRDLNAAINLQQEGYRLLQMAS